MKKKLRSTFLLESLEARLLFSADLAPLPVDGGVSRPEADSGLEISLRPDNGGVQAADAHEQLRQEIIFVDEGVDDYQRLIFDLESQLETGRQFDIVKLDSDHDGIAQISAYLRQHQDIDAVHVISHGADGEAVLGNSRLNTTTLDGYAQAIEGWQQALSGDADLLFYGCDLAAGNDGQDLVNSLTLLTGADVAASDDITGSAKLGGDWVLEYGKGQIETAVAVNSGTQQSWNGVLATYNVTTTADGVAGSLREAIMDANALGGANEIILDAGTYTLSLGPAGDDNSANGDLDITSELTITGAGAATTVIDANSLDRVFHVKGNTANLTLTDLTITGGNINNKGGGIFVEHQLAQLTATRVIVTGNIADDGAGIFNDGIMTLTDVVISNNGDATTNEGGGIHNKETAILERVTISGNRADKGAGGGGGIHNDDLAWSLSLTNVTVSGNSAAGKGGGLHTQDAVTIINSTFTLNSANNGGGISNNGGTVDIKNTIVAENVASTNPDVEGTFNSQGYNLIGDKGAVTDFTTAGDQAGTAGSPVDPMLDILKDNGGFTETHALLAGSPAIDPAGVSGAPSHDQRGFVRDGIADIGAFEYNAANTAPTLTATGAATVQEGAVYTLNLSVSDPDSHTITSWTINWGDGTIETFAGNPSSVTHTYSQAGFTYDITVSATDVTGTYIAGDLISTSLQNDRIYWFDPNNPLINTWVDIPGVGNEPVDVQFGPDGEIYVTGFVSNKIFRYNVDGSFDTTFVDGNGLSGPARLAFGPDGNLYVTNLFSNEVLRFSGVDGTSNGVAMGAFISTGLDQPDGIAFGPDGNLYVANKGTGDVLRFDGVTGALDPTFTANGPFGYMDIQFGPDGRLWVTNLSSDDIRRYSATDGAYIDTFASAPVGATDYAGIAFGPDGYVYMGAFDDDKIIRCPVGDGSSPEPFVPSGTGGLNQPVNIVFAPAHQVMVIANQAPVLSGGPYDLGSTDEDTISTGVQVTTILGGLTSSDADGDTLGIAVVTANGNGTWQYSTNSTNGTDGTWTAFGSVNGSSALLLSESSWVRYVPDGLNGETASLTIHAWDGTSGTASTTSAPSTADPSVGSAFSSATADASLTVTELSDASAVVWLTTKGNANAGGLSWSDAEIAEFGDAGDAFDIEAGLTSGTFAKLAGFSAPADIRAMHYVETNISLGTTGIKFPLQPGDLILTLDTGAGNVELNTHDDPANPGNNFFADRKDIVVFRPDVAGDYSSGEWFMLLEEGVSNGGTTYNVHALTLVERDTTVGDTLLQRGTFLVAHSNPSLHSNVYTFSVIGTGIGANTQTTDTNALLLGTPIGNGTDQIQGLHLVQQDTGFGSAVLKWGTLLVEVNGSSTFAGQAQEPFDILALTVTQTEQDASPGTAATGSLLFDGSDIGLTDGAEEPVNGLTIVSDSFPLFTNSAPNISGGPYNLGSTDEDTTTVGTQVSTIFGGLTANDADGDDLGLAVTTASGNGTWQYSTDSTDGSNGTWTDFSTVAVNSALLLSNTSWVRYQPDLLNGETASLTFHAWDGSTGSASVTGTPSTADPAGGGGATAYSNSTAIANLTVTDLNDAPTITSVANTAATEDSAYSYTLTVNDVDLGDTLTLSAPTLPGWLTFNTSTGLLSGTPTNAEVGDHAVVLRVNDGTVDVDQSFTITVANTNDAPTITSVANTAATEDSAYSYTLTVNDVDLGDTLTLSAPTLPGWLTFNTSTGLLSGTPTNAEVGDHAVVLRVNDGTVDVDQSFTITVANVNDAPTITSVANTAATEDLAYSYTFTVNDVDVGDTLTLSAPTLPGWLTFNTSTGLLSGTPTNAEVGDHAVVLRVNDGTVDVDQSFTITVANTNDAPTITSVANTAATEDLAYSYTFTVNDVDVGDTLTLSAPTLPGWLTFNTSTGLLSGTPTNAEVGDHAVVLRVNDGTVDVDQSFTITVANTNDAPTITSVANTAATEDSAYSYTLTVNDVDLGDTLTLSAPTLPGWLTFNTSTGLLSGTPTNAEVGDHAVVLRVNDGTVDVDQSFTITVANVNDAGTVAIDNTTPAQGDTLTANVIDPDGTSGTISYQWFSDGAAIGGATGKTYTTVQADVGTIITVSADYTDDQSTVESLTSAGTAAVTNVNDTPVAVNDNLNATEDHSMTITSVTDLLANDSDIDGDTLTLSGFSQPANGILVDNADGTLAYTPGGNFWGIDSFTYTISDGNSGTASGTAIIVIAPVGDTPQVTDVSTLSEVQSGLIFINRNASDGAEVSHFKISGISNGSLYLADGVTGLDNGDFITVAQGQAGLRFTPAADSTVNGSFKVESSEDGVSVASQSGIATSIITVLTTAPPPAASEPSPPLAEPEPVTDQDVVEEEAEATDDLADETDVSVDAEDIFSVAKPQSYKAPSTAKPSFISGIADHNPANSDSDDKTLDRSTLLSPQSLKMLLEAQNLGELKTALGKLNITTLSSADYELVRNSLDAIKEEMGKEILLGKTVLGSAMATTVGLSAGYVVWMLKGGSLLASVLSSLPAWQLADPLAILVGKKDDDDDDDESLETIIKEGSARDKDKKRKASELNNLRKDSAKR